MPTLRQKRRINHIFYASACLLFECSKIALCKKLPLTCKSKSNCSHILFALYQPMSRPTVHLDNGFSLLKEWFHFFPRSFCNTVHKKVKFGLKTLTLISYSVKSAMFNTHKQGFCHRCVTQPICSIKLSRKKSCQLRSFALKHF